MNFFGPPTFLTYFGLILINHYISGVFGEYDIEQLPKGKAQILEFCSNLVNHEDLNKAYFHGKTLAKHSTKKIGKLLNDLNDMQDETLKKLALHTYIVNGLVNQANAYLSNNLTGIPAVRSNPLIDKETDSMVMESLNNAFEDKMFDDDISPDVYVDIEKSYKRAKRSLMKLSTAQQKGVSMTPPSLKVNVPPKAMLNTKPVFVKTQPFTIKNSGQTTNTAVTKSRDTKKKLTAPEYRELMRRQAIDRHVKALQKYKAGCPRQLVHAEFLRKMAQEKVLELKRSMKKLEDKMVQIVQVHNRKDKIMSDQLKQAKASQKKGCMNKSLKKDIRVGASSPSKSPKITANKKSR